MAFLLDTCLLENGEQRTAGFVACCVRRIRCLLRQYLTTCCFVASIFAHWLFGSGKDESEQTYQGPTWQMLSTVDQVTAGDAYSTSRPASAIGD
jgi:hypothetical protein